MKLLSQETTKAKTIPYPPPLGPVAEVAPLVVEEASPITGNVVSNTNDARCVRQGYSREGGYQGARRCQ